MGMRVESVHTYAGQVISEFVFVEMIPRQIREAIMDYCDQNNYKIVSLNIYDVGYEKGALGVFDEVKEV